MSSGQWAVGSGQGKHNQSLPASESLIHYYGESGTGNAEVIYMVVPLLVRDDLKVAYFRGLRWNFGHLPNHIYRPQQEDQTCHKAPRKDE